MYIWKNELKFPFNVNNEEALLHKNKTGRRG